MLGMTGRIVGVILGLWLVGFGLLVLAPDERAAGDRGRVRPADAVVVTPYQAMSGRYTVFERAPAIIAVVPVYDCG